MPFENFRWTAHTGGLAIVKPKDYEPGIQLEASSPYAAWKRLAEENAPLRPGDLLEALEQATSPVLQIAKYIGFEPAQWFIPEPKMENPGPVDGAPPAGNNRPFPENLS